jgi:drug/metabolite transporter (DMT)-like permease
MKKKEQHRILGSFLLLMAAIVWGIAFVAQSEGMRYMGPFYFNGIRFALGGVVLLPVIMLMDKMSASKYETRNNIKKTPSKVLLLGGIICGLILFVANGFQQIGIMYSTVGKAGFITTLYIILVPILGIFIRKIPAWNVWISVFIAAIGLFLLCFKEGLNIKSGGFAIACMRICVFSTYSGY